MKTGLFFLIFLSLYAPARAQCGYPVALRTRKDYCLGSSVAITAAHSLKKIVWYRDGQPVDSALAKQSLDSSITITLKGAEAHGALASDGSGNIYSIDYSHNRIVKWAPAAGTGVTTAGSYGFGRAEFLSLFVDPQNNVYLANSDQQVVLKYSPGDTIGVPVIKGPGGPDGFGAGLFVDCGGTIYVCNASQQSVTKWAPGATSGTVVATSSESVGSVSPRFAGPIRVDSMGNIFALSFDGMAEWTPGATSGTPIISWAGSDFPTTLGMWMGGDDTVLMTGFSSELSWLSVATVGPGNSPPKILGTCKSHQECEHPSAVMDVRGNIFAINDCDPVIYELKRHSSIDSVFTPTDTGVYYAVVTDLQGYAVTSNKLVINSPLSGTPSISISATASSTPVCTPITFTASSGNFGLAPSFQWEVSGVPAGGNSTTYSNNLFADGDKVYCILQTQAGCSGPVSDTSNVIVLAIDPQGAASVTIATPKDSICQGDNATFTATVVNGTAAPVYEWLVNGMNTGDIDAAYSSSNFTKGDVITCLITSDDACGLAKSNSIALEVSDPPAIAAGQVITILHGHSQTLDPVTSGDIDQWAWTPATGLSDSTIPNPVASPDTNTLYTLMVKAPGGCSTSGTILVNVYTPLSLANAFTPNGDGHNDLFYVLGGPVNSRVEDFAVYDRYGIEVFHAHGAAPGDASAGWNGRFRGVPAPIGTYVYQVVMQYAGGRRQVYKGTVVLIR